MKEKTVLFVSHRLASCRFCDKILVLNEGRIFESGSHDALMKIENGLYQKMFQAQAENYVQLGRNQRVAHNRERNSAKRYFCRMR